MQLVGLIWMQVNSICIHKTDTKTVEGTILLPSGLLRVSLSKLINSFYRIIALREIRADISKYSLQQSQFMN